MIQRKDHEHFKTLVRVNVSDQFFGWIASLGPDAVIASPDDVRDRYREFLEIFFLITNDKYMIKKICI